MHYRCSVGIKCQTSRIHYIHNCDKCSVKFPYRNVPDGMDGISVVANKSLTVAKTALDADSIAIVGEVRSRLAQNLLI